MDINVVEVHSADVPLQIFIPETSRDSQTYVIQMVRCKTRMAGTGIRAVKGNAFDLWNSTVGWNNEYSNKFFIVGGLTL
jgi:hypothetical protein